MKNPLVSVIIPIYNSESYLEKCIKNILEQSYKNLQIIFVNDGSTDKSLEICKKVNDDRVEVYSKENGGASSARNFGLKYRKGKYVLFVDSDDYLKNNAIEKLVSIAEQNNADCVYYEADNFTEEEGMKIKKNGLMHSCQYPVSDGNTLIKSILDNKNYHAVPFLYFTNSLLYDKGLNFEEGIMLEDELFSFRLLRMCEKVVCLKEILYYRNVRPNSVMTSTGKELFRFNSISVVYERLFENLKENKNDTVYLMYLSRIAMLWFDYSEQLTKEQKQEVRQRYIKIKSQITENKGFGRRELSVRCHGRYLWLAYIAPGRFIKRLKR